MMFSFYLYAHNKYDFCQEINITERKKLMKIKNVFKCVTAFSIGGVLMYIHRDKIMQCSDKIKQFSKKLCCCEKSELPTIVLLCDAQNNSCKCTDNSQEGQKNSSNYNCDTTKNCCCNMDEYTELFNEFSDKANSFIINTASLSPCCAAKFDSYTARFGIENLPAVLIISNDENLIAKNETPVDINEVRTFIEDNLS